MSDLTRMSSIEAFERDEETSPLDPWICPTCGPVEPLRLPGGRYIRRSCACERAERRVQQEQQEHAERMQKMAHRTYGGWLDKQWSDISLASKTFENMKVNNQPREEDRKRLAFSINKAKMFARHPVGTILFYGQCGLGKTHLLAAICNSLRERDISSLFTTSPRFFTSFYDRMEHSSSEWELVDSAILTPFLVIDDLDKATPKPFRQETFFQIIDERVNAGRPMGISTNDMEGLAKYIGDQAYSRLKVGLQPVFLTGQDYRSTLTAR